MQSFEQYFISEPFLPPHIHSSIHVSTNTNILLGASLSTLIKAQQAPNDQSLDVGNHLPLSDQGDIKTHGQSTNHLGLLQLHLPIMILSYMLTFLGAHQ